MRIVLDVSIAADNRIEGTASWADRAEPVPFTGWLALMRVFEDAKGGDDHTMDTETAPDVRFGAPDPDP